MKLKLGVYCRFSSGSGGDDSLDKQWEMGKEFALNNGYTPIKYMEGGGVSGKLELEDRIQGNKLLKDLESGYIDGIIIKHISRLVRNELEGIKFKQIIKDKILYIDYKLYDFSQSGDVWSYSIQNLISDQNKEDEVIKLRMGMITKYERGELSHGKPLYGYKRSYESSQHKNRIIIDKEESDILIKVFNRYLKEDITSFKIFKDVCDREFGFKRSIPYLSNLVRNDVKKYSGEWYVSYFKHREGDEKKDYHINCKPIVDENLRDKVLTKSLKFKLSKTPNTQVKDKLYQGSIYCGECGRSMVTTKVMKTKYLGMVNGVQKMSNEGYYYEDGNIKLRWKCLRRNKNILPEYKDIVDNKPHTTAIDYSLLDNIIRRVIYRVYSQSSILKEEFKNYLRDDTVVDDIIRDIDILEDRIKQRQVSIDRLQDDWYEGNPGLDKPKYHSKMNYYVKQRDNLKRDRDKLKSEHRRLISLRKDFDWKLKYTEKYSYDEISSMGFNNMNKLYNDIIDWIEVKRVDKDDYQFKFYFKYNIIGDSRSFDNEDYHKWKKSNPYKLSKEYPKKLILNSGRNTLNISSNTIIEDINFKLINNLSLIRDLSLGIKFNYKSSNIDFIGFTLKNI